MLSLPAPPSRVSLTMPAGSVAAPRPSSPPRPADDERVVRPLAVRGRSPGPTGRSRSSRSRAAKTLMMSLPAVPLTITVSAAPSPPAPPAVAPRSRLTWVRPGPGQVVDGDRVGPAEGVQVDPLDAVQVHDDGADVAGEPDPGAVGREVELLGDVGPVEQHRVRARPGPRPCRCRRPGSRRTCRPRPRRQAVSLPRPPMIRSLPSPPNSRSAPSPPVIVSLPVPAVDGDLDQRGQPVAGGERVVPAVQR